MERKNLFSKKMIGEEKKEYCLDYSLLMHSTEYGNVYGIEIRKTANKTVVESDRVEGVSERMEEAEYLLRKLAEGLATPVELAALCDDYISEREYVGVEIYAEAAS